MSISYSLCQRNAHLNSTVFNGFKNNSHNTYITLVLSQPPMYFNNKTIQRMIINTEYSNISYNKTDI